MILRKITALVLILIGICLFPTLVLQVNTAPFLIPVCAVIGPIYSYIIGWLLGTYGKHSPQSSDAPPSAAPAAVVPAPIVPSQMCDEPPLPDPILDLDKAPPTLREQIIHHLHEYPSDPFKLADLIWDDAKDCILYMMGYSGDSPCPYDGIWFYLNLKTQKITAKMASYPNAFGASRESELPLSAELFHELAVKYHLNPEVLPFRNADDWAELFSDDSLRAAIAEANSASQKQAEAERQRYAIQIPASYTRKKAAMSIEEIDYTLMQRYAITRIRVTIKDGRYHGVLENRSLLSSEYHQHVFNPMGPDAVWLEKKVESALSNPDNSTWQSLAGGDRMKLVIQRRNGKPGVRHDGTPITKYTDMMHRLARLAEYQYTLK